MTSGDVTRWNEDGSDSMREESQDAVEELMWTVIRSETMAWLRMRMDLRDERNRKELSPLPHPSMVASKEKLNMGNK